MIPENALEDEPEDFMNLKENKIYMNNDVENVDNYTLDKK